MGNVIGDILPQAIGVAISPVPIIAVILSVQALKVTRPVMMPIAFAFFITVLVEPLHRWLAQRLPKWVAMVGVLLVLAAILGVFVGAIEFSLELIEPKLPQYADRVQSLVDSTQAWLRSYGLPTGAEAQCKICRHDAIRRRRPHPQ